MLSMRYKNKHICGAVIIGKNWSLTAAHCCIEHTNDGIKNLSMRSGSDKLYKGGQIHQVTKVVRHFKYFDNDDNYDLCAVKVTPNFEYSDVIAAVNLPNPEKSTNLKYGLVSGWGYTKPGGSPLSPILKSINITRVDLHICKHRYRNIYFVHDTNICYGSGNSSDDSCQGDSGGPLVNVDNILIGIVSFGYDCGFSTLPGVYTDVIQFRSWIKNITNI